MDGIFGTQNRICLFLSITEETEVIVNSIDDDVWEFEYEITGVLIDGVESWDWLCL